MKLSSSNKYFLSISNYKLIIRTAWLFGVLFILSLMMLANIIPGKNGAIAPEYFFFGFLSILVVEIGLLLLITFFILTKKAMIWIDEDSIISESGSKIPLNEIKSIELKINRNTYQSLMIINLKGGKKYSITPTNKFRENAMKHYNGFRQELNNLLPFE